MKYMVWSTTEDRSLIDADDAVAQFDDHFNPWGQQFTMIFGPEKKIQYSTEEWPERALQVDVDFEADRAAVRWLSDDTHGVELDPPAQPIIAGLLSSGGPEEVPTELARVSIDKARDVVREYVTTGVKPTCVRWETD